MPLAPLYAAGSALRWIGNKPLRLKWPVVSVGSLSAGGAGKTPFVIALARLIAEHGRRVDVLSRGYGRTDAGVARVDAAGFAERFGDEPLLIAREAQVPVFVGAQRFEAGRLAESEGEVEVHLLDDGFQHRQLYRQVDIVLVSSEDLKDWLLPAGNRREPLSALRRATAFAVAEGDDAAVERLEQMRLSVSFGWPVWRFRREMVVPEVPGPVVAFCGIARPGQFFSGLERAGVKVVGRRAFPDHHRFSERDLADLRRMALETGAAGFVTTGKDAVRLNGYPYTYLDRLGLPVAVANVQVIFPEKDGPIAGLWGWRVC